MKTLDRNCSNQDIKNLVVEWNELLAKEKYEEAFAMFPTSNIELDWTPELLKKAINTYGTFEGDGKSQLYILKQYNTNELVVTSILARDDKEEILKKMNVDRFFFNDLGPSKYLGKVFYEDVPLCGFRSELTGLFNIIKFGEDKLTLEFESLHVM